MPGRTDRGQRARERLERRVAGEDVGPAPEDRPEHLEVAPEGVEERQVAEQRLVDADGRQRGRPGEALRDQRVSGVDDTLRQAGAAGGEHHRRRLRQTEWHVRLERALDLRRRERGQGLGEVGLGAAAQGRRRVEQEELVAARTARPFEPQRAASSPSTTIDVRTQPLEDPAQAVEVGVRVERAHGDAVHEAREVGAGGVDPVPGEDQDARPAPLRAQQHRGGLRQPTRDRLVAPDGRTGLR